MSASEAAPKRKTYFGLPALDQAVSGVGAGALSTLLVHPLDVVRVRLQIQDGRQTNRYNRPQYRGAIDAFRTIVRTEGWRTLYQGLSPNLAGATLSWGLYFFWYDIIKHWQQRQPSQLTSIDYMVAAAEAGALTSLVTNPIWLVKTRMAMQLAGHPDAYNGLIDGLRRVYASEGVRGLYKGFVPSLFSTLHGSLQFLAYENLKIFFQKDKSAKQEKLPVPVYLFIASTSKIFATCGTYPFQVIRARLQDQRSIAGVTPSEGYNGIIDMGRKMWRNEGIYGFYRGMIPSIFRVLPATCVTFLVYEHLTHLLLDGAARLGTTTSHSSSTSNVKI